MSRKTYAVWTSTGQSTRLGTNCTLFFPSLRERKGQREAARLWAIRHARELYDRCNGPRNHRHSHSHSLQLSSTAVRPRTCCPCKWKYGQSAERQYDGCLSRAMPISPPSDHGGNWNKSTTNRATVKSVTSRPCEGLRRGRQRGQYGAGSLAVLVMTSIDNSHNHAADNLEHSFKTEQFWKS